MLQPGKKKSTRNTSEEGPAGSYMIGLDKKTIATNARIMKEAAKVPKMKMMKDGSTILSPLRQKKQIVEKGSYDKGKVEKYASKSAMIKHEKKENKSYEKKEEKKMPPTKMKKC